MIRALLSRARAALNTPGVRVAIAGACLKIGMDMLVSVVAEMRDEVTALQAQLTVVESAGVPATLGPDGRPFVYDSAYPTPDDLDPLGRGE